MTKLIGRLRQSPLLPGVLERLRAFPAGTVLDYDTDPPRVLSEAEKRELLDAVEVERLELWRIERRLDAQEHADDC